MQHEYTTPDTETRATQISQEINVPQLRLLKMRRVTKKGLPTDLLRKWLRSL